MPRFNGDITRFYSFWQSFESAIDKNESLTAVDKFNYLVNILEGEAFRVIQGLEIVEENYEHAKETLHQRFGHKQKIIQVHMDSLLNLQHSPNDTIAQLRQIFDSINIHIRGLESLGVNQENYGSLLIMIIMKRMPKDVALQVSRETKSDIWSMKSILDIIRKEIEARETCSFVGEAEKRVAVHRPKQPLATISSFHAKEQSNSSNQCYFCEGEHLSFQCERVTDPNKRKEILLKQKRCFICLKRGHRANSCNSNRRCRKCNNKHHQSICLKKQESQSEKDKKGKDTNGSESVTATAKSSSTVLMLTAKTHVVGKDSTKKTPVTILFDSGSQKIYITEALQKKLGLQVEKTETMNLNTFGSEKYKRVSLNSVTVNVEIGDDQFIPVTALSHSVICTPLAARVDLGAYSHLSGLKLADCFDSGRKHIDLLIGLDHFYDFVDGEVIRGSTGPIAIKSKLSWLLAGKVDKADNSYLNVASNLVLEVLPPQNEVLKENQEIVDSLKQFWKIEASGLHKGNFQEDQNDRDDIKGSKDVKFDITHNGKRYEVSLPWKVNCLNSLPDDYDLCLKRLWALKARLAVDSDLLCEYNNIFEEQLAHGIIERVPTSDENNTTRHFLAHHCVIRKDHDTTKVRVVFDGSAKANNESLSFNDRLELGDNFIPPLFDNIFRFRLHLIAITADIEKAFLQVGIKNDDRDYLRFLWFDDVNKAKPAVIQYRFARLSFGLKPSPSILGATIHKHIKSFAEREPKVVDILKQLYVDDMSCGAETIKEAVDICKTAKNILLKEGLICVNGTAIVSCCCVK